MKNSLFFAGMPVFVLVFGIFIIGCGNNDLPKEPDDDPIFSPIYDPSEDTSLDKIPNVLEGVTFPNEWEARRYQIRRMMQDEYYGQWRSGESVSYTIAGNILTIKVSHGGNEVQFFATVQVPTTTPPESGYPVILAFGGLGGTLNTREYSLSKGYANISVPTSGTISAPTNVVASDDNARIGAFYTLYPYGTANTQTGVLMAWAWGASKVLDALEKGAAAEFNIDASKTIITGTSRNGKAAAVAGAFEERFKITVPVSSGAGGCAIYRYASNGQTYDLSKYFSYNGGGSWTVDANNPQSLTNVQGDSGGGWFNAKFRTYTLDTLPFDQHFLLSLCAAPNRYLFMVNGFEGDKWTNPPGFFYAFQLTYAVYKLLGIPQNIAVSMHRSQHGFEQEDMVKLIKYANFMFYGIRDMTFDFAEEKPVPATWRAFMESLHKTPFSLSVSPENNAIYQTGKPR